MAIFYDTNVLIGYIFKWDKWNSYSENSFNNKRKKYWSEKVEKEFNHKIIKKIDKYINFLTKFKNKLDKNSVLLDKNTLLKNNETIIIEI